MSEKDQANLLAIIDSAQKVLDFIKSEFVLKQMSLITMIEIKKHKKQYQISFPESLVDQSYVEKFLDYLRYAEISSKSRLSEEDAMRLSEELKSSWWEENKDDVLKRMGK